MRSTVAQKCHGNLLTAISICSRQFQFTQGNFNLLTAIATAISVCSPQFQFAHSNFIFFTEMLSIFRFAHYLSTMAADSSYQTSKHKIESRYLQSIFLTAPRKLYKLYLTILFTAQHLKMMQSLTLI